MELLDRGDPSFVGPYRLLARLGQGGMGQVFLARSPDGALVAAKVVHVANAGDSAFRRRFAHEVASARRVHGEYTVRLLDSDTEAGLPWLVTEYVRGYSLADIVDRHGPLAESTVRALGCGIARALESIHAAGVVHRDIKPANVLMAANGPRLVDFGVSRATEASTLTLSGQFLGTAGYAAPEQVEGRTVDGRSDAFGLGAVLVFALTGTGPFGEGATLSRAYRVVHNEPEVPPITDPALAEVIRRCLAKDPAQRPTPAEIAAALGPALTAGFVPPDWLPDEAPAAPARKPGAGATTLVRDGRPAGNGRPELPATGVPVTKAPAADPRGVAPVRRRRRALVALALVALLLVAAGITYALGPWSRGHGSNNPVNGALGTRPTAISTGGPGVSPGSVATAPGQAPSATAPGRTPISIITTAPPPPTPPAVMTNPPPGIAIPDMPTGLTATPLSTSAIRLQWSDNSTNESGFLINYSGSTHKVGTNRTTYDWGGLSAGTYACFAIAAFNAAGYSDYYPTTASGWICASTPQPPPPTSGSTSTPTPPPAAPSGLTATALNGTTIRLQWSDNSSTETGFEIDNAIGSSRTAGAGTTQYDWTGLSPGTNMCFQIRAYNAAGPSAFSPATPTVCATTPGPPAAPTNFTVTQINPSTVRLQWTDNSTNETSFLMDTGWAISNLYSTWGTRSAGANVTSYDFGLPEGSWRCFRLRSVNSYGYGEASPTWTCAAGTSYSAPATPTNGSAIAISSTSIRLQWTDNANNEGTYEIVGHGNPVFLNPNTTSAQFDLLSPGTQYCFTLGAVNLAGSSGGLGPLCATTLP